MKKILTKAKRIFTVLLASALIAASLPQTDTLVYAAEQEEGASDAAETQSGIDTESSEADTTEMSEESLEETVSEEALEEVSSSEADTVEEAAEEKESLDDMSETLPEGEETESALIVTDDAAGNENLEGTAEGNTVTVSIVIPYHTDDYHTNEECALSSIEYQIGDGELQIYEVKENTSSGTIEIKVPENGTLYIKPVLKKQYVLESVWSEGTTIKEDENGGYTWTGLTQDRVITMSVERLYFFTFDALNAKIMMTELNELGEVIRDETNQEIWTEVTDTIPCPLSKLDRLGFKIQVSDGCFLRAVSTNSTGIFFKQEKTKGIYQLIYNEKSKKAIVLDETKIFVTAEPAEQYEVALDCPDDISVTVETMENGGTEWREAALTVEKKLTVSEGTKVMLSMTTQDVSKGFYVSYTADGTENAVIPEISEEEGGIRYSFNLGALHEGDAAVKISSVGVHGIAFEAEESSDICLSLLSPLNGTVEGSSAINEYKALVPDGYELRFMVSKSGTGIFQASASTGGQEIPLWYEPDDGQSIFKVRPTEDMKICVKLSAAEFKLDYMEEDIEDIQIYEVNESGLPSDTPLELTENNSILLSDGRHKKLEIRIKPAEGKRITATYDSSYNMPEYLYSDDITEDGYIIYTISTDEPYDYKITVKGHEICKVTFIEDIDADSSIGIKRMAMIDGCWEEWWDDGAIDTEWGPCTISVDKGSPVYFSVPYMEDYRLEYVSTTGNADGSLRVYDAADESNEWDIYRIVPEENMTITVKMVKLADYNVNVVTGSEVGKWDILCEDVTLGTNAGNAYVVKENSELVIRLDSVKTGYRGKVTYKTGEGAQQDAGVRYYTKDTGIRDESGRPQYVTDVEFCVRIKGDTTINIDIEPVGQYTVTFDNAAEFETIKVWENGNYSDADKYPVKDGKITLDNDKIYYFNMIPKAGKGIESVSAVYGTSDSSVVLSKQYDYDAAEGWMLGKGYGISQDVTIHTKLLDAYTLSFDISQTGEGERVYSWTEYDMEGYNLDITDSKIPVPETGSYTFFIESGEYDVITNSDAFEIKKSFGYGYDAEVYVLYTIASKQDVKPPAEVTVSFVKKTVQTHVLTLNYPDTVSRIFVESYEDGIGTSLQTDSNKQVTVSGSALVLNLKTAAGFEPSVTIQGASDSEAVSLAVYRAVDGYKEYYIGEVSEDKTITVTTERKSDTRKYYDIGFYALYADVKESVHQIPYYTNGYIDDPELGDYLPYSIEQGKSISFFVEPYYGYEISGVFIGDELIKPTRDNTLQKDVYTVTPTRNSLITVKTRKSGSIYNKYNVTFTYPNEVRSVTVQGYELGANKKISVPAGTTISFKVELAGENYEVRSVTANDTEVPYDKESGMYTLTTGSEDTSIVILAGSKTPAEQDKKHTVTFTYPDEVKTVTVQGYKLGADKKISVPAGTAISFKVELAGENYEVRSVTANDTEVPYDKESGMYTLTAVSEDTVIVILTGSKTPSDPNKKHTVTFIYPNEVKGIIFKDNAYTLANNRIRVPDGAKVYFKIDLTEGYEVDSTIAGNGLKMDSEDGYYVLTVSGNASLEIKIRREKPEITGITIEGVKDGKVQQLINLRKEYQIVPVPSNANISGLRAEVTPEAGAQTVPAVKASIKNCMLTIDTTNVTGNESAVIKIYNDRTNAYVEGGTFTVNVQAPSPDDTYETKLTLQKGTTTIYTGQSKTAAATVKYNTDTTIKKVASVKDTTALVGNGEALRVWESDNQIYVAATEKTQLGKHTLEVSAYTPDTLEGAKAVITVNVVRGIETLEVTVPTTKLYKPANNKTTLKAAVIYNSGTTAPKAKKVLYEVLNEDGEVVNGITVKNNGTVTVEKSFTVSDTDAGKNKFRIHVKANDYKENETEAYSDWIILSNNSLEINSVYILKENESEGDYTVVVDTDGQKITTDKLENAIVVAMQKDSTPLEAGRSYTEEELISAGRIDASLLTYKSSNKAVSVDSDGSIGMTKYANKIKLTLTTTDGGKKKKDIQFKPEYTKPQELQLSIYDAAGTLLNGSYSEAKKPEASFAGTANSVLTLCVQEKDKDAKWQDVQACVNHKVTVKGGRLLSSDNVRGVYRLVVTGKTATVTLADKTEKKRPSKIYTITNTDYTTVKAPKASLKYFNNNDSLTATSMAFGPLANRKVEVTLKNASSYKYVRLEADSTVTGNKAYETLLNAIEEKTIAVSNGKFTIKFDGSDIPAGSYKLKLALSNADGDSFKAETGLIGITLKVAKPKAVKGSFKPIASYTLKQSDGYKTAVTYTAKKLLEDENGKERYELKLLNANIKGKENEFLKYFELKMTETGPVLKLKENITEEQIAVLKTKAQKDNLTGYIAYTAVCGDDGYGNPYTITGAVKIKVKLK